MLTQKFEFSGGERSKTFEAATSIWFLIEEDGDPDVFRSEYVYVRGALCEAKHPFLAYYNLRLDSEAEKIRAIVEAAPLSTNQLLLLVKWFDPVSGESVTKEHHFDDEMEACLAFAKIAEELMQEHLNRLSSHYRSFRLLKTAC